MARWDVRQLTDQYFDRIHRAAVVLTGNPWDADDLAQETCLVLADHIDRFQGRSSPYTWLYGIMLNLERRRRRRLGTHRNKLRVMWDRQPQQQRSAPAAEAALEVKQWKRSLWSHVARLPDGQRQALVLRFSEQLTYMEIAESLECPLGTVKSRIFHGLESLRKMLGTANGEVRLVPKYPLESFYDAV